MNIVILIIIVSKKVRLSRYLSVRYTGIYDIGTETCVPYSTEACMDVAKSQGLQIGGCGYKFQGSTISGYAAGCYAYNGGRCNGMAFYGTGGTQASMKQPVIPPRYRPYGYDCATNSTQNLPGKCSNRFKVYMLEYFIIEFN